MTRKSFGRFVFGVSVSAVCEFPHPAVTVNDDHLCLSGGLVQLGGWFGVLWPAGEQRGIGGRPTIASDYEFDVGPRLIPVLPGNPPSLSGPGFCAPGRCDSYRGRPCGDIGLARSSCHVPRARRGAAIARV